MVADRSTDCKYPHDTNTVPKKNLPTLSLNARLCCRVHLHSATTYALLNAMQLLNAHRLILTSRLVVVRERKRGTVAAQHGARITCTWCANTSQQ